MKKLFVIFLSFLLILILSSCIQADEVTEISTYTTAETVSKADDEATSLETSTTNPADIKSEGQSTTEKANSISSKNQNTTKTTTSVIKQTTAKTTTKKVTTAKQITTTSVPYWCTEGGSNHVVNVGTIGWYSSYTQVESAAHKYLSDSGKSGRYLIKECACGLFTAYVTLNETPTEPSTVQN